MGLAYPNRGGGGLTQTAADAAYQPLDSDLTAVAAIATQATGRSLLGAANAAAIRVIADAEQVGVAATADAAHVAAGDPHTQYLTEAAAAGTGGAGLIGILDTAGLITATTLEAALAEIAARLPIGIFVASTTAISSTTFVAIATSARSVPVGTYRVIGGSTYTSSASIDAFYTLACSGTISEIQLSSSHESDGINMVSGQDVVGGTPSGNVDCVELVGNAAAKGCAIQGYIKVSVAGTVSFLVAGKTPGDVSFSAGTGVVLIPA